MDGQSIIIQGEKQVVQINIGGFPEEINGDDLTSIDYTNLWAEIITIPTLINKIGILRAEAEAIVKEESLDLEYYEAQLGEDIKKEILLEGSKFSSAEVERRIRRRPEWLVKQKNLIRKQRDLSYVESLYWSIKDKSKKLENMSYQITPSDLADEIVEQTINTISIKTKKSMFNNK
jgi:hypothetical protein